MSSLSSPKFQALNPEVYYLHGNPRIVTDGDLDTLARLAAANPRRRCRICLHRDPADPIHEMLIAHGQDVYVPPHAHRDRDESFTLISGRATLVIFTPDGRIDHAMPMGPPGSGRAITAHVPGNCWHSQVFETSMVLFHEVTSGPFDPASSRRAPFAPSDDHPAEQADWLARLRCALSPNTGTHETQEGPCPT